MKEVTLAGKYGLGKITLVDDDIAFEIRNKNARLTTKGYVELHWHEKGHQYYQRLSRLIMDAPIGMHVDHINGDKLDNRRNNLRICTNAQNQTNRRKSKRDSKSKFKGIAVSPSGRYGVTLAKDKKNFYIGTFKTEHQAALVYDLWAIDLHGEFANTNFPVAIAGP